jgi:hypothetical protein
MFTSVYNTLGQQAAPPFESTTQVLSKPAEILVTPASQADSQMVNLLMIDISKAKLSADLLQAGEGFL